MASAVSGTLINELKLNTSTSQYLDDGDAVIVFRGDIYPIHMFDDTESNVNYTVNVIRQLCDVYDGMENTFFDYNGNLKKDMIVDINGRKTAQRLFNALFAFGECPKMLFLNVTEGYGGLTLVPEDNEGNYDVDNSKELQQFLQTDFAKNFKYILLSNGLNKIDDFTPNETSKQNTPIADKLYHGTCLMYATEIMSKGIRSIAKNSTWGVHNDGYVFLTTSYAVAKEYAMRYSRKTETEPCVFEIDSSRINADKIALDYDFSNAYVGDIENSPYDMSHQSKYWKCDLAKNTDRNGTKFCKIGYNGIIMPSAISGIYVLDMDGDGQQYYTKEQFAEKYNDYDEGIDESKRRINEWKPDNYEQLPDRIRLYHGTDVMALNDIIEEGVISAKRGRKRSETYGVNWFSTKLTSNFGHGTNFSIEVPKSDFDEYKFVFMNNSEVTSRIDDIPIDEYNLRIERIGDFDGEDFKRVYDNVVKRGGDIFDYIITLNKINREFAEWGLTVDYPVVMRLIEQLFGKQVLVDNGITESKLYINEVDASDISLSSFTPKQELNGKFWINDRLNSRVREKLIDIANDFIDELSISNFKPEDIVFTGSLANYNWSKYSDIDVHIVISFKSVYKKIELIDDYFKSKKEIWTQMHENLKIYGFPVEISVENSDEPGVSSGVYSLLKNKWLKEPDDFDDSKLNEKYIKGFSADVMTDIDNMKKRSNKTDSNQSLDRISERAMNLFKRLKNIRKEGLSRSGEMSSGNIIWKVLKRSGYLDKLWEIINSNYDKVRSLK